MSGIESDGGAALNVAYVAISAFLLLILLVLLRTIILYGLLLLLPVARLLRWVPGMRALVASVERRAAQRTS